MVVVTRFIDRAPARAASGRGREEGAPSLPHQPRAGLRLAALAALALFLHFHAPRAKADVHDPLDPFDARSTTGQNWENDDEADKGKQHGRTLERSC